MAKILCPPNLKLPAWDIQHLPRGGLRVPSSSLVKRMIGNVAVLFFFLLIYPITLIHLFQSRLQQGTTIKIQADAEKVKIASKSHKSGQTIGVRSVTVDEKNGRNADGEFGDIIGAVLNTRLEDSNPIQKSGYVSLGVSDDNTATLV